MAGETWKLVFSILDEDQSSDKYSEVLFALEDSWYRFRTVCKVTSSQITAKIVLNLKLMALRTYYLCRTTDEAIFKNITGIINSNYIQIVSHIFSTPNCTNGLVQNLRRLNQQSLDLLLEVCEVVKQQDCLILTALVTTPLLDYERQFLKVFL